MFKILVGIFFCASCKQRHISRPDREGSERGVPVFTVLQLGHQEIGKAFLSGLLRKSKDDPPDALEVREVGPQPEIKTSGISHAVRDLDGYTKVRFSIELLILPWRACCAGARMFRVPELKCKQ